MLVVLVSYHLLITASVFDILSDFHVYIENPPQDQSDRWSGRSFRSYSTVFPPAPVNLDPIRTASEKDRFLENLWNAQAKYRTRSGQSVVLCADEREVESRGGKVTTARTYFNVYQRTDFLLETKKVCSTSVPPVIYLRGCHVQTKIVMHIDSLGTADPIPFGMNGPPYVVVRVQPMAGEISRYTVTSSDPPDEPEEDIVQTSRIPGRIVQTSSYLSIAFPYVMTDNCMNSPSIRLVQVQNW
jgi:protein ECT2